jgi:hypothetical protein
MGIHIECLRFKKGIHQEKDDNKDACKDCKFNVLNEDRAQELEDMCAEYEKGAF